MLMQHRFIVQQTQHVNVIGVELVRSKTTIDPQLPATHITYLRQHVT